ncbi:MAG: Uma2 family endonuclease [Candidatus Entotheonellia bacterium]
MVTAPTATTLITGEELLAMGDIGPCELIDGRIVPMSPTGGRHGIIESRLGSALSVFVQQQNLGWVLTGEVGIYIRRNPDRVRGADIVFLSRERWPEGPPEGFLEGALGLVVEIMSPNDRWQEVRQKIAEYFSIGVRWVWIVEPENRAVLVFRSSTDFQPCGAEDSFVGEGALEGFTLPVASLLTA